MLLQAYDFVHLAKHHDCLLQIGGSDQWGNLTSGTDLIHRAEGKSVHAIGTPLITNSDGTKFGKSEGNAVWLDASMTSPYAFYQFWLNSSDADAPRFIRIFSTRGQEESDALIAAHATAPHKRQLQKELAAEHLQVSPELLLEIAGCYAFWMWLRLDRSAWWIVPALCSLTLFALILTRVEAAFAGRAYAERRKGVAAWPNGCAVPRCRQNGALCRCQV